MSDPHNPHTNINSNSISNPTASHHDSSTETPLHFTDPFSRHSFSNPIPNTGRRKSLSSALGLSGSPTYPSPFIGTGHGHSSISTNHSESAAAVPAEDDHRAIHSFPPLDKVNSTESHSLFSRHGSSSSSSTQNQNDRIGSGPSTTTTTGHRGLNLGTERPLDLSPGSSMAQRRRSSIPFPPAAPPGSTHPRRYPGEGFNWSEALRARAERDPSLSSSTATGPPLHPNQRQRTASIESIERPVPLHDVSVSKPQHPSHHKQNTPDFFQEKILKGDYID